MACTSSISKSLNWKLNARPKKNRKERAENSIKEGPDLDQERALDPDHVDLVRVVVPDPGQDSGVGVNAPIPRVPAAVVVAHDHIDRDLGPGLDRGHDPVAVLQYTPISVWPRVVYRDLGHRVLLRLELPSRRQLPMLVSTEG